MSAGSSTKGTFSTQFSNTNSAWHATLVAPKSRTNLLNLSASCISSAKRVVYFQRNLRPRGEHQHIFHFTHALSSLAAAPPERRSFFAIVSI